MPDMSLYGCGSISCDSWHVFGEFDCVPVCFGDMNSPEGGSVETRHDPEHSRYLAEMDGVVVGRIDYVVVGDSADGDVVRFEHTVVPPAFEGRGIAHELTAAALDDVRASGRLVVPVCSYTASFLRRNPEYADLAA
jgi:predicted GNAT family acetyltransferase